MINSISGKIFKKEPTTLYIENNGIVFSISICIRDYEKLPSENENIFIYTYLNVKENLMELYGFMDLERRSLFLNLIDVSELGLELLLTFFQMHLYQALRITLFLKMLNRLVLFLE